jgi:hypothetical protein
MNLTTIVSAVAWMRLLWWSAEMPPLAPDQRSPKGQCGNIAAPTPRGYLLSHATFNGAKAAHYFAGARSGAITLRITRRPERLQ